MFSKGIYRKYLGFDDRLLRIIGIPVLGFFLPIIFMNNFWELPQNMKLMQWGISTFFTAIDWHLGISIFVYFRWKFPEIKDTVKKLSLQYFVLIGTVLLLCFSCMIYLPTEAMKLKGEQMSNIIVASLSATLIVAGIYESKYYLTKWKNSLLETERLKKENARAHLAALQTQVNPHFLFNSLNTLTAIIPENPDLSVRFVQRLSHFYRSIIDFKDQNLISVEKELSCLESYIFLLSIRFDESLKVNLDELKKINEEVLVPLSLQIILENVVKHNVISQHNPMEIKFALEDDYIVLRNPLRPKISASESTKTGLSNISKRYKLLSENEVIVYKTKAYFEVKIPRIKIAPL